MARWPREEGLLRAQLANAGVPFEMTGMMLRRIDRDVPDKGHRDDRRSSQWRAANIAEMERRLKARSIRDDAR
jgi:hypothetical protein